MIHCHQHTIATSVSRRRRARVAFCNSSKLNKMVKVRNRTRGHLHDYFLGDIWGIFELVVKESGGERSDGEKKKPSLPARALLSFPSSPALLACSVVSTKPWESLWRKQLRAVSWSQRTFPNMRLGLRQNNVSQAMLPAPERELGDPARAAAKETRSNRNVNDKTNPVQTFSGFVTKPVNHH